MLEVVVKGNNGRPLKVSDEGEISVVIHQHPPIDEEVVSLPFRQYFVNSSSSNVMKVDGSVTSVDFYIEASPEYDIYLKYVTVEIGDGGNPSLNDFGDLAALSNGVSFYWDTTNSPEYVLHEGIKTNKEFLRIGSDTAAIGDGTTAFLADVSGGAAEKSYLPAIDFKEIYGLPWGLRLRKGSLDRLVFRINDDLTSLTTFNAIATGTRI